MKSFPKINISWPLAITISTWAVNFVAIKKLYVEVTPAAASIARMFPMWIILVIICLFQKEPLTIPKADRFRVHFQGMLSLGIYMILFFEGLARTGGAEGAILLSTAPIWTALIAMLARQEPFRPMVLIAALIAFSGTATVILGRAPEAAHAGASNEHLLGVLLVLSSAAIWAWATVISKPLLSRISPIRLLAVSTPIALLVLLPYGGMATLHTDWASLSLLSWALLFHVTVLAGVVGFIGFYMGVKQVGAAGAMFYQYFIPPLAAIFEWFTFGKSISLVQFGGFAIVVFGVWLASRFRSNPATLEPAVSES